MRTAHYTHRVLLRVTVSCYAYVQKYDDCTDLIINFDILFHQPYGINLPIQFVHIDMFPQWIQSSHKPINFEFRVLSCPVTVHIMRKILYKICLELKIINVQGIIFPLMYWISM